MDWFKYELKVRMEIYEKCNCMVSEHVDNLRQLIMCL